MSLSVAPINCLTHQNRWPHPAVPWYGVKTSVAKDTEVVVTLTLSMNHTHFASKWFERSHQFEASQSSASHAASLISSSHYDVRTVSYGNRPCSHSGTVLYRWGCKLEYGRRVDKVKHRSNCRIARCGSHASMSSCLANWTKTSYFLRICGCTWVGVGGRVPDLEPLSPHSIISMI